MTAKRVLLSVIVHKKMFVHGMDVIDAFLNRTLEHELYMDPPEGFFDALNLAHVYKLHKSVYRLNNSPWAGYSTILPVLEAAGVTCVPGDSGIFTGTVDGHIVMLAMYLDDLFIACTSKDVLSKINPKLMEMFAKKDHGTINHNLGLYVNYDNGAGIVSLFQSHATKGVL